MTVRIVVHGSRHVTTIHRPMYVSYLPSKRYGAILDRPSYQNVFVPEHATKTFQDIMGAIGFESFYRVLLHYSSWSDKDATAKIVTKAVPNVTFSEGLRVVEAAEKHGLAIIVTVPLAEAQLYDERLRMFGLKSSIEIA